MSPSKIKFQFANLFIIITTIISVVSCNSTENKVEIEMQSPEPFNYIGNFIWEGKADIGYGLSANMKITQTILRNGNAITTEFTKETGETITDKLQYFIDKDGAVVFGKFNTSTPNENSEGAQYILYPNGEDLISNVSNRIYKRVK